MNPCFPSTTLRTSLQAQACPHCSTPPYNLIYHSGACPKVKSVEYHLNGHVKKIEFK